MRVLIAGAGIAGPTLAYWLLRAGHQPALVERAPELRRGGYLVDFWGAGFDVAERMGSCPSCADAGTSSRGAGGRSATGVWIASVKPAAIMGSGERYVEHRPLRSGGGHLRAHSRARRNDPRTTR